MKKKFLLAFLLSLALASCHNLPTSSTTPSTPSKDNNIISTDSGDSASFSTGDKKTLILYFDDGDSSTDISAGVSNSGGGNRTASIASKMHNLVDSDLLELTLANPYTSADLNYSNRSSRVITEYNNGNTTARPVLARDFTLEPSKYSHIVVGYPLWWMHAPWPYLSLFESDRYDFTGIVFGAFDSNGYGNADIDSNLRAALPNNTFVAPGYFSSSSSDSSLKTFLDTVLAA